MNTLKTISGGIMAVAFTVGIAVPNVHAADDVVDTAVSVEELSTLVTLVGSAGLVDTLKNAEDITVFAPTNSAFEKLPRFLLRAINNDPHILTAILTYHVAPERLLAEDVVSMKTIDTLEGSHIRVRTAGDKVLLNTSRVTTTDIETSNAIVHLIDRVLIPWQNIRHDVISALRNSH